MYSSLIILAASSLLPKIARADAQWCTFYTENDCQIKSGHDSYDIGNPGIFQNGGPYLKCGAWSEFSLISYPPGDSSGNSPNHCGIIDQSEPIGDPCYKLSDWGFTTGDGGYYRFSKDKMCPPLSSKRGERRKPLVERNGTVARSGTYVAFFDDPACEQQSGGVHYNTANQGCFENGGAYFGPAGGDDISWHLEQWTGTDNFQCADTMENCKRPQDIPDWGNSNGPYCFHLDDFGFKSGFGSYKIGRGGCP